MCHDHDIGACAVTEVREPYLACCFASSQPRRDLDVALLNIPNPPTAIISVPKQVMLDRLQHRIKELRGKRSSAAPEPVSKLKDERKAYYKESESSQRLVKKEDYFPSTNSKFRLHINDMPEEIIVRIMALIESRAPSFVPALSFRSSPYSLIVIASVCKLWRDITLQNPHLWSIIDDAERPGFDLYLSRSQESLLTVYIHADAEWSLQRISSQVHRIRELHIAQDMMMSPIPVEAFDVLSQAGPHLHTLTLLHPWHLLIGQAKEQAATMVPNISRILHSNLRHLTTRGWLGSNLAGSLTHICMSLETLWEGGPSLADMFRVLQCQPNLERVLFFNEVRELDGTQPETFTIMLPYAQTIGFGFVSPSTIRFLLSRFRLPIICSLQAWSVWWDYRNAHETHLGLVLDTNHEALPAVHRVCRVLCTLLEDTHMELTGVTSTNQVMHIRGPHSVRSSISWDALQESHNRTLCSIPSIFRPEHLTHLCIGSSEAFLAHTSFSSDLWHTLLSQLESLQHVTVIQSDALPTIEALHGGTTHSPPCPNLEILELRHNRDIRSVTSAVWGMVSARQHSQVCSPLSLVLIVTRYENDLDPPSAIRLQQVAPTAIQIVAGPGDVFRRPDQYLTTEQERSLTG
jgi:hypothetical protein